MAYFEVVSASVVIPAVIVPLLLSSMLVGGVLCWRRGLCRRLRRVTVRYEEMMIGDDITNQEDDDDPIV